MDENERKEKTPEEIYLDELYSAMESGGELPDGTVPFQIPSLNDPKQQFRKIELPVKRKKTLAEHAAITINLLSLLYLFVGFFVYREALLNEDMQPELFGMLFYVFAIGVVMSAIGVVVSLLLKEKIKLLQKLLPIVILAAFITMLTFVI